MTNDTQLDDKKVLLRRLMEGLVRGEITLEDLQPRPQLSRELIAKGWSNAVAMLRQRAGNDNLLRSIHILKDADPTFASADFLLGMAYYQTNKFTQARECFHRQVKTGLHTDESERMLSALHAT